MAHWPNRLIKKNPSSPQPETLTPCPPPSRTYRIRIASAAWAPASQIHLAIAIGRPRRRSAIAIQPSRRNPIERRLRSPQVSPSSSPPPRGPTVNCPSVGGAVKVEFIPSTIELLSVVAVELKLELVFSAVKLLPSSPSCRLEVQARLSCFLCSPAMSLAPSS